ncbi:MAG: orotidine-5'-phosphate decarboxylase [Gammaproteobacteria bacterium]|nr:MAG: orotidine-5'-phosphate decarboxylase [Gammaproteobacteria bacterium]
MSEKPIIVALDYPDAEAVMPLVKQLDPAHCRLKVGKEMFTREGPGFVSNLIDAGFDVFLDLKFHDIPNTVANACKAAAELGVWMVNVHALGGRQMMLAAREAIDQTDQSDHKPLLIGVTILTSMDKADLEEVGLQGDPASNVLRLAGLAKNCGLDGVVCSPREVTMLRQELGQGFTLVTPGIRPADAKVQDQKRVMTPADAIAAGSSYLVIGRPISGADNPLSTLLTIESEIRAIS